MTRILLLLAAALVLSAWRTEPVTLTARAAVLAGDSPHVTVAGLEPGETVVVHGVRTLDAWSRGEDGQWGMAPVTLHAWARVTADDEGRVDMDTATPEAGSYRLADGTGLIWSGYRRGDTAITNLADDTLYDLSDAPPGAIAFRVERGGEVAARGFTRIAGQRAGMTFVTVSEPGLTGVFATPAAGLHLPVVIQLHGSEGSDAAGARDRASRFASRGYATFAVTYFARRDDDPNTPDDLVDIPIEVLAHARDWLAGRPEADVERIAVHGWSKGAELALAGAERYPWIDAVVACVPTDLVWQGGGAEPGLPRVSSWTFDGAPLPFVPLYPFIESEGVYRTNTDRYERSLRELGDADGRARIAVERSDARFLFLGADRDAVWASGAMARRLEARLEPGKGQAVVYPTAGHDICGPGGFPPRLYANDPPGPQAADPTANGEATLDAARRTMEFLRDAIGAPYDFMPAATSGQAALFQSSTTLPD